LELWELIGHYLKDFISKELIELTKKMEESRELNALEEFANKWIYFCKIHQVMLTNFQSVESQVQKAFRLQAQRKNEFIGLKRFKPDR